VLSWTSAGLPAKERWKGRGLSFSAGSISVNPSGVKTRRCSLQESLGSHYLKDAAAQFHSLKALADKALAQVTDAELFATLDPESNSIAVIMKHLAGNMLSRWSEFLTSDGEKADRNRDSEFELTPGQTRTALFGRWESGWLCLLNTIGQLSEEDLSKRVLIRGQEHSVIEAINRQLTHYACHVGQIVFLAKHLRSKDWQSLSIPRGKSSEFNAGYE
jgi:hypothetical protein